MTAFFVTFEGLDGSGKSTHLKRYAALLEEKGIAHRRTQEPGGTPLGEEIRRLFLGHEWGPLDGRVELLLLFASRRHHLVEVIEPALAEGIHVLCDRFTDSTLVYQGLGRGVPIELIDRLDELATGRRRPDRTLVFDLPAEEAWRRGHQERRSRGSADRIDTETVEFYHRVREGYQELVETEPARFRRVDSRGSRESTWEQVVAALADLFPEAAESCRGSR
jgi:dTMP kinase